MKPSDIKKLHDTARANLLNSETHFTTQAKKDIFSLIEEDLRFAALELIIEPDIKPLSDDAAFNTISSVLSNVSDKIYNDEELEKAFFRFLWNHYRSLYKKYWNNPRGKKYLPK